MERCSHERRHSLIHTDWQSNQEVFSADCAHCCQYCRPFHSLTPPPHWWCDCWCPTHLLNISALLDQHMDADTFREHGFQTEVGYSWRFYSTFIIITLPVSLFLWFLLLPLTIVQEVSCSDSVARNAAIHRAKHSIVLFITSFRKCSFNHNFCRTLGCLFHNHM